MSKMIIQSERLWLILQTTEEVLAKVAALSHAAKAEISPDWLARVRAATVADPWTNGFSIVDRATDTVIGSCGYKGPPDSEGVVEIGYGLDQEYRGRGFATEAAMALVTLALDSEAVGLIRAHTVPGNDASVRVLMKCGFKQVGEVVDPEDGLVLRWERAKAAA